MDSRYCIGIDLGTSNCTLAYRDLLDPEGETKTFLITQLEDLGVESERETLPSFIYLPRDKEGEDDSLRASIFPAETSPEVVCGEFARKRSLEQSERVVASAKSWLCHGGVSRSASILPWGATELEESEKISPIRASSLLLQHLVAAWNSQMAAHEPAYRIEHQKVVVTVPASFDEVAQELTLQAALDAGLPEETMLLEEPQAAFYRWLETHDAPSLKTLSESLGEGSRTVLVCDVGGGTTDFSLFSLVADGDTPRVRRLAVSDHILLGGDNFDLALAYYVEQTHAENKLSTREFLQLVHALRNLKEQVLGESFGEDGQVHRLSIAGLGSSLFSSARTYEVSSADIRRTILEGFFPDSAAGDRPNDTLSALREWGLPYEKDTAITKHLASFLEGRNVDAVLFNGGALRARPVQERILNTIAEWQQQRGKEEGGSGAAPVVYENEEPHLAVARGAAHFAYLATSGAKRIEGGFARSLYVEVEQEGNQRALVCLVPQGAQAGSAIRLDERTFEALVNQPASFNVYYSTRRAEDRAGDLLRSDLQSFHPLAPLQTVLRLDGLKRKDKTDRLRVFLQTEVSELGRLHVYCVSVDEAFRDARWELRFNLRSAHSSDGAPESESAEWLPEADRLISVFYGKKNQGTQAGRPRDIVDSLEKLLGRPRAEWTTHELRTLWPSLEKGITRRGRSIEHETTWLSLAGFLLRPGFGAELDEWRVSSAWKAFELGLAHPKEARAQVQWWIFWRRIAGGLDEEKQEKLYAKAKKALDKKGSDLSELYRLIAALEKISQAEKVSFARVCMKSILGRRKTGIEASIWALGRVLNRAPLNASAHTVLPPKTISPWIEQLLDVSWSEGGMAQLPTAMQRACRMTGDRSLDLDEALRLRVVEKMRASGVGESQTRTILEPVGLEETDKVQLFGEDLPIGLRLA